MAIWFTASWWDEKRLESLKKDRDRAAERVTNLLMMYHRKHDFKGCSDLCRVRKLNVLNALLNHRNLCLEILEIEREKKIHCS